MDDKYSHGFMALCMGMGAKNLNDGYQRLFVQGVTSQGVFLKTPDHHILFLTDQPYPGPLTINIPNLPIELFNAGEELDYENKRIIIRDGNYIDWTEASLWVPSKIANDININKDRIRDVYDLIQKGEVDSLASYIPAIVDHTNLPESPDGSRISELLKSESPIEESLLDNLLGWGRGLTPSGDDFLCGIALGITRYHIGSQDLVSPPGWQEHLKTIASQKTTLVSANILEWAFLGQSDLRILDALDGLLLGISNPREIAKGFRSWGNSSGLDTFTGMVFWLSRAGYLF